MRPFYRWTADAVHRLQQLAKEGVPVPVISVVLRRPIDSVREKLQEIGVIPSHHGR